MLKYSERTRLPISASRVLAFDLFCRGELLVTVGTKSTGLVFVGVGKEKFAQLVYGCWQLIIRRAEQLKELQYSFHGGEGEAARSLQFHQSDIRPAFTNGGILV